MTLRAIDNTGTEYTSYLVSDVIRKIELLCPSCKQKLVWVNSDVKVKHFRHLTTCQYNTEPESKEHIEMKKEIYELIKNNNNTQEIVYEKTVKNRIADIYLKDKAGQQIVVECQCTKITAKEMSQRTKDYNDNNIYVLWILNTKNFNAIDNLDTWSNKKLNKIVRVSNLEKELHKTYFGRVYYFDVIKKCLYGTHFETYSNYKSYEFYTPGGELVCGEYTKYYKTVKYFSLIILEHFNLFCTKNDYTGKLIARFADKKWW